MIKLLFTGLIMAAMLMVSSNLLVTDYEVSGAGTSLVNGVYVENGTHGYYDLPKYKYTNGGTTYYLFYNLSTDDNKWVIHKTTDISSGTGDYYYINSGADTPPETGNNPVISAASTCQNITIQANSTLTINSSHTLDVTGDFTLEANGDFTNNDTLQFLGSDCNLSDNRATKSSLGNVTVEG